MERITGQGNLSYRTRCLERGAAERFAKALAANSRFTEVSTEESPRAMGSRRWFVQFVPSNPARVADMRQRQQLARKRRSERSPFTFALDTDGDRPFYWCHSLKSGEVYQIDPEGRSCSCADSLYRCRPNGLLCKHSLALLATDPARVARL
jgi:hypothetical protein